MVKVSFGRPCHVPPCLINEKGGSIRERRASRHQACDPTVRGHLRIRGLPGSPARKERGGPRTGPSQGHFCGYAETARAWARNGAGGAEIGILGPSVTGVSPFPHNFPTPDLFKFDSRFRYQLRFKSGAWEPSRPRAEPTAIPLSSAWAADGDVGSAGGACLPGFGFCVGLLGWRWSNASWR